MRRHIDLIEKYRYIIAGFLILTLILLTYATDQFGVKESMSEFSKEMNKQKNFDVKDRCGMMPTSTTISHTISSQDACDNECRARCASEDLAYDKAIFEEKSQGCNQCSCECE